MSHRVRRRRPVFRFLMGALYSVIVAGLLLEISLRVFDPIGIRYYFDTRTYFKAMQPDDDYAYLHTPGYHATLQGVDVEINREGLRGPEFDVTKGARRRLLILGDSVVFGWGAPQQAIFPAVMQQLIADDGLNYEVIAAGAGSWNTRTEYEFFRKRALAYEPDVVVLLVVPNDVEPKDVGRTFVPQEKLAPQADGHISIGGRVMRTAAKYSYGAATMRHIFKRKSAADGLLRMYDTQSPAWKDTDNALGALAAACEKNDVDLVVFLYADLASDFSRAFQHAYAKSLDRLGVPHYVLPADVYAPEYRNSLVDGHPNAAGHRLIAEEIYRVIHTRL